MLKKLLGFITSTGSSLIPGIGPALKFGPYVIIALLAAFIAYQRVELKADNETIRANEATCAAQEAANANALNTAANTIIAGQQKQLDDAENTLAPAASGSLAQHEGLIANARVEALQPGQDGPLAPVYQDGLAGLRLAHGDTQK